MSYGVEFRVPANLVEAAIRAARKRKVNVADVPLAVIAAEAGMSRSTLLRRLHGTRRALDEAVGAAGVDPGTRPPMRSRVVDAAATLISERGLASFTLDAVANAADCSVYTVQATFGGRDGLLAAVYERYSPITRLEGLVAESRESLKETVRGVYRMLADNMSREPRVAPAMLADLFSRPDGPVGALFRRYFPRALSSIGGWLDAEVRAGRIRPMPLPLLIEQLVAPLMVHLLLRPVMTRTQECDTPSLDEVCDVFADTFLRAVAMESRPTLQGKQEDEV